MAMFAKVDDVLARYDGEPPLDKLDYIDTKLSDAERKVTAVAGDLMSRIVSGQTTAQDVKIVLCDMVIRVLRNTDGVKTQSVGPFSYTLDTQVASGRLFVTREERRLLGMRSTAGSVSLSDADAALERVPARPIRYPDGAVSWPDEWPSSTGLPAP